LRRRQSKNRHTNCTRSVKCQTADVSDCRIMSVVLQLNALWQLRRN